MINALAPPFPSWSAARPTSRPRPNAHQGRAASRAGSSAGRNIHFGVREHGMGAIRQRHGAARRARARSAPRSCLLRLHAPRVRLACAHGLPSIYVCTHDSIGAGRGRPDPPAGRAPRRAAGHAAPARPAPGRRHETAEAWRLALGDRRTDGAGARSRQALPVLDRGTRRRERRARGAYVLGDAEARPRSSCRLRLRGAPLRSRRRSRSPPRAAPVRVVSLPCPELFAAAGRRLPRRGAAPCRGAASRWKPPPRSAGRAGWRTRMRARHRTASALRRPERAVLAELGITSEHVVEAARRLFEED